MFQHLLCMRDKIYSSFLSWFLNLHFDSQLRIVLQTLCIFLTVMSELGKEHTLQCRMKGLQSALKRFKLKFAKPNEDFLAREVFVFYCYND